MYDDEIVLLKYNPLFFSEAEKEMLGNIYFIADYYKCLYLMHFISNRYDDYCR